MSLKFFAHFYDKYVRYMLNFVCLLFHIYIKLFLIINSPPAPTGIFLKVIDIRPICDTKCCWLSIYYVFKFDAVLEKPYIISNEKFGHITDMLGLNN